MIRFFLTSGHEYCVAQAAADSRAPRIEAVTYDALFSRRRWPPATCVFTDFDRLNHWDLQLAAAAYRQLKERGARVLNDPARVKMRYGLLRALHEAGINRFNIYRAEERVRPERYPVFVRQDRGHGWPVSDLLHSWDEVVETIDTALETGIPESTLCIVEYAGEPVMDGLYRKLSMYRVGDRYFAHVNAHEDTWLVKYGKKASATADLYDEELEIIRSNPFRDRLQQAFEIAGIEYGRADFGLLDGEVQVFEINTNPDIQRLGEHPVPQRNESQRLWWRNMIDALRDIDTPEGGRRLKVGKGPIRPYVTHLPWRRFRSRRVP